jgi:hypothetical protein
MDNADMAAVDELLTIFEVDSPLVDPEVEVVEMETGAYDVSFFQHRPDPTSLDHLGDARVGLGLFIDEAMRALEKDDLTVDQRVHVATILSYIEGLTNRFDVIRVPGFVQAKKV